jgi:hypothetical protein
MALGVVGSAQHGVVAAMGIDARGAGVDLVRAGAWILDPAGVIPSRGGLPLDEPRGVQTS